MDNNIADELESALNDYKNAVKAIAKAEDIADYHRLIAIVERLTMCIESGDIEEVKLLASAFGRCVTDSFAIQPEQYRRLSGLIHKLQ